MGKSSMKAIALVSGGIDSPVAAHLMKNKMPLKLLYFDNSPFAGKGSLERVKLLAKKLDFNELLVMEHGPDLAEFMKNCDRKYMCVFCRRMMLRIAEAIAKKQGAQALVTGESLAQVASQTLQNLYVEDQAVQMPVIRPLIGFDKNEIIKIAKEIGTYDISIIPVICCSAVPSKPSTQARLEKILGEEEKININELLNNATKSLKKISI